MENQLCFCVMSQRGKRPNRRAVEGVSPSRNCKKSCPTHPSAGWDICPADGGRLLSQKFPPFIVGTAGSREVPEGTSGRPSSATSWGAPRSGIQIPYSAARSSMRVRRRSCLKFSTAPRIVTLASKPPLLFMLHQQIPLDFFF